MKFLTMCEGGCVRSVAMAMSLKVHHDVDAIACSTKWNPPATLSMLFNWADYIVVMEKKFELNVPEYLRHKVRVVDVGPDRYGSPMNLELNHFLNTITADWKEREWKL